VSAARLHSIVAERGVLVCVGSGGVGKTTSAAAIGAAAARSGRRVVVLTVDPARRLADALGVASLPDRPVRVALAGELASSGELWAAGLDTKATFDRLVRTTSRGPAQAQAILENRFYRSMTETLSGTTEYLAAELLHELAEAVDDNGRPRFDLLVVDTPPSRHALDFVTAPTRLLALLNNALFRAVTLPARTSLRIVAAPAEATLRLIGSAVGGDVVADAIAFFRAFDGMEEGFRARSQATLALLGDASRTAWALVTTARPEAVEESIRFVDDVKDLGIRTDVVLVNSVVERPGVSIGDLDAVASAARAAGSSPRHSRAAATVLCAVSSVHAALRDVDAEAATVAPLLRHLPDDCAVLRVPFLDDAAADDDPLAIVEAMGSHLW
jgi:anion-transporting  ArsA/GET3 family ATPase